MTRLWIFIETAQALAVEQHVRFPTHTSGNILDLVLTELFSGLKIQRCAQDDFISDHCIVRCNLAINRPDITWKVISYRKLKGINVEHNANSINLNYDKVLDSLLKQLDKALSKALDEVAPIQAKLQTVNKSILWFTDAVKGCKQFMRQREKIWRTYKTDSTKTAFIKVRSKYKQQLRMANTEIMSNKVLESGTDTRKLYHLVNELIRLTTHNPLPDNRTNDELAEESATFFMPKIIKICDDLNNHPKYSPVSNNPPQFD